MSLGLITSCICMSIIDTTQCTTRDYILQAATVNKSSP